MISIVTMITVLNSPSQPVPNLKRHNKDSMGALSGRLTTAVPKDQYLIWWIKSYNGCDDNEESYDENDNDISRTDPIVCWVSKEKRKHDAKSFTCIINIINLLLIIIIVCQHYYYLATSSTNIANIIIIFKHCRHHWLPFHYCNGSPPPSTACGSNLPGLLREGRRGSRWSGNKAPLNILDCVLWSTMFDNRCCSENFHVCKKLWFFSF